MNVCLLYTEVLVSSFTRLLTDITCSFISYKTSLFFKTVYLVTPLKDTAVVFDHGGLIIQGPLYLGVYLPKICGRINIYSMTVVLVSVCPLWEV